MPSRSSFSLPSESAPQNRVARIGFHSALTTFGVLGPLFVFGFLAEDVATRDPIRFDTPPLLWLHAHATPQFDQTMLAFTWLGGARVLVFSALLIVGLSWRKQRVQAGFLLAAISGATFLNE